MNALSQDGLIALTWSFTAVGLVLTAGRYIIRKRTVGKLDWDDFTHGLAVCMLLGFASTYTASFARDYTIELWVFEGVGQWPSNSEFELYSRSVLAVSLQFWLCLYLVKLSFLLLYWRIFGISQNFMKVWWIVAIFTLVTFLVNFLAPLWSCNTPAQLFVTETCLSVGVARTMTIAKMWCGLNVASDLAIMALPLFMLHTLQMRIGQKLGLAAIFLVALVDIAFDIFRTIYSLSGVAGLDIMGDILEATIAVIISCLPTYRALFSHPRPRKQTMNENFEPASKNIRYTGRENYELSSSAARLKPGISETQDSSVQGTIASVETSKEAINEYEMV